MTDIVKTVLNAFHNMLTFTNGQKAFLESFNLSNFHCFRE